MTSTEIRLELPGHIPALLGNITLPARVLRRIDAAAKAAGESRSGFIAHLALRS